ncbi:N-acetylmuramoyl-L-alanine amidase, partial [Planctomycetota bacterium]|nr:N-acetylmuramoyl-L-alanine amidase [Planctomycetota bacterium]
MTRTALVLAASLALLAAPALADIHLVPNENGALSGKTIVMSPGHGYMWDSGLNRWRYQRGVTHTMREDIHTNEIFIEYLQYYLANAGARVESCRERSFQTNEVIVDNADAGYSETGTWGASTSAPRFRGANYKTAPVSANGNATATFSANLPESGNYPVYVWFTTGGNRSTQARYTVHHSGGATTVAIDQRAFGNSWVFVGDFHFAAGTAARVELSNQGADPATYVIADAVRFGGGVGASGQPRWREGGGDFLRYKGFQSTAGEVSIRPAYATWVAGGSTTSYRRDMLYFALHTNASGGSGTARGLSCFSYSNGRTPAWGSAGTRLYPAGLEAQADRFRDLVQDSVMRDVRANLVPAWPNRGSNRMNFGELRGARNMPAALLELGFHDNAEDAALLSNPTFRETSARAIYKAMVRYFDPNARIVPLPVANLRLENQGSGDVRVSWDPVQDAAEPSASPTAYKVYVSQNGYGFDNGTVITSTSHTISGLSAGAPVFVRVAAVNGGGESLPSGLGGALVGDPMLRRNLLVDGFDRNFVHTEVNVAQRFRDNHAVEHVNAMGLPLNGEAVDFATNEAVTSGGFDLARYALADWLLGREGSLTRTFDATEQQRVTAFLQGGGALFTSGTDIGWDLEARSGGQTFLNDTLSSDYTSDNSGSFVVKATPGSPFYRSSGTLQLHDGSQGSYRASSTDV